MPKRKPVAGDVSFTVTREEAALIDAIVERALPAAKYDKEERTDLDMDLSATHANGTPLDFAKLLAFDEFNLWHDINGIYRYLDRVTGRLTNHFLPRCAKPAKAREGR